MDRNLDDMSDDEHNRLSLSARRAWIEITVTRESFSTSSSLSARRAWIEIDFAGSAWVPEFPVALRKESVDRNNFSRLHYDISISRSPQGERG